MVTKTTDDAGRRLVPLAVVSIAAASVVTAVAATRMDAAQWQEYRNPFLGVLLLTALANAGLPRWFRSSWQGLTATSAAVIVGSALMPAQWVVLAILIGVAPAKAALQAPPARIAYGIAKDTLAAAAAAWSAHALHLQVPVTDLHDAWPALATATAVFLGCDVLLTTVWLAVVNPYALPRQLLLNWDIRLIALCGNVVAAALALIAYEIDHLLIAALPLLILAFQLTCANRIRTRAERETWRKLGRAMDELNGVDLDTVLRAAVTWASDLLGADEVEVVLYQDGVPPRASSGPATGGAATTGPGAATDSGPPVGAGRTDPVILTPLESHDGGARIGELRLRYHAPVTFTEREQYALRTFAAALCTAIRNATTHDQTRRLAEENERAAARDTLTGLPNRRGLLDLAGPILAGDEARLTALLLIDLNEFKEVNDTLGHRAGDRVLADVAVRLAAAMSPGDALCRLGGDEFAVLFRDLATPTLAVPRARSVLASLNQPIDLDGMPITIEASGGLAAGAAGTDVSELLRRADVALHRAKRTGQQICVYARAHDTADVGRLSLGGDLARAVAEREFTVNFQPIVDLESGMVVSAEALARWLHPERGPLHPHRFLDSVERSGLLAAFAQGVLDQALRAVVSWREAGFDLPVAVNVSPRSLLDPTFPKVLAECLKARGVPADRLVVELTESLTLSQLDVVDEVLDGIRDLGIRLALDDFGTGYSSLGTLARVRVHELKIDRAFVSAMDSSVQAAAVVRSTIDLGRRLNMLVVAEGVESAAQRRKLWQLGCPTGQGHLFGRPVPSHRMLAALKRGSAGRPGALAAPLRRQGEVIPLPRRRGRRSTG